MFLNAKMYLVNDLQSIVLIDGSENHCQNGSVRQGDTFDLWLNLFYPFISLYRAFSGT